MKKITFMLLILSSMLLTGCLKDNNKQLQNNQTTATKKYCETASDCIIFSYDPDGFNTCVNKEWIKNVPESEKVLWECINTGREQCGCIDNECQRIDAEPGC